MASQADGEKKPELQDISAENLTSHVIDISTKISDERVKYIFTKLIQHAHDFVRDVDLQKDEWEAAWQFLTDVCIDPTMYLLKPQVPGRVVFHGRGDLYVAYEVTKKLTGVTPARSAKLAIPTDRR